MTLNESSRHAGHGRTPAWKASPEQPLRAAAENLRLIRLHLQYTQGRFGEQLGYSASGLDKIERLDVQMSLHTLSDLVRITGIPADRLLDPAGLAVLKTDTVQNLLSLLLETPLEILLPEAVLDWLKPEEAGRLQRIRSLPAGLALQKLKSRQQPVCSGVVQGLQLWLETLQKEPLEVRVLAERTARSQLPFMEGLQQIRQVRRRMQQPVQLSAALQNLQLPGGLMLYWQSLVLLLELDTAEDTFWHGLQQMEQLAEQNPSLAPALQDTLHRKNRAARSPA